MIETTKRQGTVGLEFVDAFGQAPVSWEAYRALERLLGQVSLSDWIPGAMEQSFHGDQIVSNRTPGER